MEKGNVENESKINISTLIFFYTMLFAITSVTIIDTLAQREADKSVIEILLERKNNGQIKTLSANYQSVRKLIHHENKSV